MVIINLMIMMMERVPDDYFDYDYDNHHNDPYMMIVVNVCPKNDLKKLCFLQNYAPGKRWLPKQSVSRPESLSPCAACRCTSQGKAPVV